MGPQRVISIMLVFCLLVMDGCSSPPAGEEAYHPGPKINLPDFIKNTAAYKGKTITLLLKIEEAVAQDQGPMLRDYLGRDVRFRTTGPRGEQLSLVITLPKDLAVPDVGSSDEVSVRFVCTRGSLRQGNEAKSIEKP